MFRGIRGRMLLSYLLLIVVTLIAISISFILILNTRPAPTSATLQGLAVTAITVDPLGVVAQEADRAGGPLRQLGVLRELLATLTTDLTAVAAERDVRIFILRLPNREIVFDSGSRLTGAVPFAGTINTYSIPAEFQRGQYAQVNALGGSFIEDGVEWLYIAVDSLQMRTDTYYVAFADERPRQTLQAALADFGTEVFPLLIQSALVSLVIAVGLATVISRSIARPMQNMAQAAGQIAEGKLDQRVPVEGTIEMKDMGAAFNRMVDQLRDEQRSQQDFLANVSHDLKTPLTSIQGYSQAIVDGAAPNPVRAAQIIYDEAARLNRMVVELTDLARLQAGRMSMQLTALDLGQLATAVGQRLAIMAQEKRIRLTIDAPPMPPISGDGDRMDQVITNLVSNAIKYTPEGGSVMVRAAQANGGVMVEVQDSGIGIDPEQLPRIFERFYQVDKARGPRRGTGLGLAIVQEIVTAHGGTISVSSEGKGRGSTFTLWLPSPQVSTIMRRR